MNSRDRTIPSERRRIDGQDAAVKRGLAAFVAADGPGIGGYAQQPVPVLRPQLPDADRLLPYLRRIDQSRVYSNWGPLVNELSERLRDTFGAPEATVVCASSGMSAIVAAVLASAGRAREDRPLAIVPDFTFAATALACQMCGYEPVLANCDTQSWTFSPAEILGQQDLLPRVGLVMPVAPFGRVVQQQPWIDFQERTGIPVVIDGAACFEAMIRHRETNAMGPLPVALSFHATKSFGTGEGGAVVTTDPALFDRVVRAMNFGFIESRNSALAGFNGKMPEYAAAVGLAELDGWQEKQRNWHRVFNHYSHEFEKHRIAGKLWGPPEIGSNYVLLECANSAECTALTDALRDHGIDTRLWYGAGLATHDLFRTCTKLDLHGRSTVDPGTFLGLPMAPDLPAKDIQRICSVIHWHQYKTSTTDPRGA